MVSLEAGFLINTRSWLYASLNISAKWNLKEDALLSTIINTILNKNISNPAGVHSWNNYPQNNNTISKLNLNN